MATRMVEEPAAAACSPQTNAPMYSETVYTHVLIARGQCLVGRLPPFTPGRLSDGTPESHEVAQHAHGRVHVHVHVGVRLGDASGDTIARIIGAPSVDDPAVDPFAPTAEVAFSLKFDWLQSRSQGEDEKGDVRRGLLGALDVVVGVVE